MAFSGSLDAVELGQVFQMLSSAQKTGRLVVSRPGEQKEIWFGPSGLALQVDDEQYRKRVLSILRAVDKIPEQDFLDACEESQRTGSAPLPILLSLGVIQPEDVDVTFQRLMAEEVFGLFEWKGAHFQFHEEDLPGPDSSFLPQFLLKADSVVMEAARRMDEWSLIRSHIPDSREIYSWTEAGGNLESSSLGPDDLRIFELTDGLRSVHEIVFRSGLGDFETQKKLAHFRSQKWIRPLERSELAPAGREAMAQERYPEAANLLERAIELGIGLPQTLEEAAQAREAMGEYLKAAEHYKTFADLLGQEGEPQQACEVLLDTMEWFPTDLSLREQLMRLLESHPRVRKPNKYNLRDEALEIAELYAEAGELDKCLALYRDTYKRYPRDRKVKVAFASRLEEVNKRQAIKIYEELEKEAEDRKELKESLRLNEKILTLDPKHRRASGRNQALKKNYEEKKKKQRIRSIVALALGGLVLTAVFALLREQKARETFATLGAEDRALQGDFLTARKLYKDFLGQYSMTFIADEAHRALERIDQMEARDFRKKELDRERAEKNRARRLVQADRAYREAELATIEGRMGQALSLLRKALTVGPLDWEERAKVEEQIQDLESYIRKAETLHAEAQDAERKGDFLGARARIREILDTYPHAPIAANLTLPFRITTHPDGAKVLWKDDTLEEKTPMVVRIHPESKAKLRLEREGFAVSELKIVSDQEKDPEVNLLRIPDKVVALQGLPVTQPSVNGGRLYVGLSGGKVAAFSVASENLLWTFSIQGFGEITTRPLAVQDLVYFAGSDRRLYAVNLWGEERWRVNVERAIRARPLMYDGSVYAATEGGEMISVHAESGKENWRTSVGSGAIASPIRRQDSLLLGDNAGNIFRVDRKTGKNTAIAKIKGPVRLLLPGKHAETYLVVGSNGLLAMFQMGSATPLWKREWNQAEDLVPVVHEDKVFLPEGNRLVSLHLADGLEEGAVDLPKDIARGMQLAARALYLRDTEGYWVAVELGRRRVRWRSKLPTAEVGFGVDPDRVWILGKDSNLYLFDEAAAQFSYLYNR